MPSVTALRMSRPRSSETASSAVRASTRRSRLPESSSRRRSLSTCVVTSVEVTPRPVISVDSPADGEDHGQEVPDRAVDRPVLGRLHGAATLEHLPLERQAAGGRVERQDVLVLAAEHLRLRALQHAQPRLVRHEVGAVAALQCHSRRGVVEDRTLALIARLGLPARAGEDEPRGEEKGDRRAAQGDDRAAGVAERGQGLVHVPLDDEADVEHRQPLGGADHGHAAVVRVPVKVDGGGRAVDGRLGHGSEGCRRRHRKQQAAVGQRSSGTRTCTLKIDEAPDSRRPVSTSSASKRLGARSRPSRSIAYASPDAPVWPLLRTTLNVTSGSTRKQSAPPELPAEATHAQTNWVGAPARTTPLASRRGVTEGSGRVMAAPSARRRPVKAGSEAKCAFWPTSSGASEASTRHSELVTR